MTDVTETLSSALIVDCHHGEVKQLPHRVWRHDTPQRPASVLPPRPWNWYLCHFSCNSYHLSLRVLCVQTLLYQVGFLVCTAIGVLYIVLMPIVGFFLACCRCCGNCGGKMYQKQTSSIHCRRRSLYWSAFVTTVIILWVCVCARTLVCALERHNDVLSEISMEKRQLECACLAACVNLSWLDFVFKTQV